MARVATDTPSTDQSGRATIVFSSVRTAARMETLRLDDQGVPAEADRMPLDFIRQ